MGKTREIAPLTLSESVRGLIGAALFSMLWLPVLTVGRDFWCCGFSVIVAIFAVRGFWRFAGRITRAGAIAAVVVSATVLVLLLFGYLIADIRDTMIQDRIPFSFERAVRMVPETLFRPNVRPETLFRPNVRPNPAIYFGACFLVHLVGSGIALAGTFSQLRLQESLPPDGD